MQWAYLMQIRTKKPLQLMDWDRFLYPMKTAATLE